MSQRGEQIWQLIRKHMDGDPFSTAVDFVGGKTKCGMCRGRGKLVMTHKHRSGTKDEICSCCQGTGYENIPPDIRLAALREILKYVPVETLETPARDALQRLLNSNDSETVVLTAKTILEQAGAVEKPMEALTHERVA
jgi:hypothetical protein